MGEDILLLPNREKALQALAKSKTEYYERKKTSLRSIIETVLGPCDFVFINIDQVIYAQLVGIDEFVLSASMVYKYLQTHFPTGEFDENAPRIMSWADVGWAIEWYNEYSADDT